MPSGHQEASAVQLQRHRFISLPGGHPADRCLVNICKRFILSFKETGFLINRQANFSGCMSHDPPAVEFTPQLAQRLAAYIRETSRTHPQALSHLEAASEMRFLQKSVLALDCMVKAYEDRLKPGGQLLKDEPHLRRAERHIFLLLGSRAFRCKTEQSMTNTFEMMCRGSLPVQLQKWAIGVSFKQPSQTFLCYRQTSLCAALSVFNRQVFAEDCSLFLFCDSSTVNGVNRLLSIVDRVSAEAIDSLIEQVSFLEESIRYLTKVVQEHGEVTSMSDELLDELVQVSRKRCLAGQFVLKSVQRHRLPPQSCQNSSDVPGKLRAIGNALALHTADLDMSSLVRKVKAMCVDRGVESKLADTYGNLADYMPVWRQPRRVMGNRQVQLLSEARALPRCLVSPGLCHGTHNVEMAIDENLSYYASWVRSLKQICKVFTRVDRVEVFLETCDSLSCINAASCEEQVSHTKCLETVSHHTFCVKLQL